MSRCMKLQSHSGFMSVGDNTGGIVLSFISASKEKRGLGLLIVSTIFAGAAWSPVSLVGGVLGIVSWATVERKEREAQAQ